MKKEIKREEFFDKMREMIGEEVSKRLEKVIIPKGYTKCAKCGSIIKFNEPCPYCEETEVDKTESDEEEKYWKDLFEVEEIDDEKEE